MSTPDPGNPQPNQDGVGGDPAVRAAAEAIAASLPDAPPTQQQPAQQQPTPAPIPQPGLPEPAAAPGAPLMAQLSNPAGAAKITAQQILDPLNTAIPPIEVTDQYRISVAFVAVVMVLLPLVYLGMIGLVGLGVVYHMGSNLWLIAAGPVGIVIYLVPVLVGGLFVLFMFKPLFAPAAQKNPTFSLERTHEPLLFDFVDRLCQCVGAPAPRRIDVTTDANASASFRRGILSMFGDDLVLTIGLPLVSALSLRQLAGVLAHEFGHFTQGSAMRFCFLVGSVNSWFGRVVFERDAWDEKLADLSAAHNLMFLLLLPIRLFIWVTRWVLWGMMYVGHVISCNMSRQMEYDADRHETRVAGSEAFTATSFDMHILGEAQGMAYGDLEQSWMEDRLVDDLPALVLANAQQLKAKPETLKKIKDKILEQKAEMFDTHPSTSDRIDRALAEYCPGTYTVEAPARLLFRDFSGLCRALTMEHYKLVFGDKVSDRNLVPTADLVAEQNETLEAMKTLYRYFQGKVLGSHEVFLPPAAQGPPPAPRQALQLLKDSRQRMLARLEFTAQAVERFDKADQRLRELAHVGVIMNAGFRFDPSCVDLLNDDPATVQAARFQAEQERAASLHQLNLVTTDAKNRMVAGLQLLHVPQVAKRVPEAAAIQQRTLQLLGTLVSLENTWANVLKLREVGNVLHRLLMHIEGNEIHNELFLQIKQLTQTAAQTTAAVRRDLYATPYPFQHARGSISIADYALLKLPPSDSPGDALESAGEMLDKLVNLYYRVMAHLAVTAEKVESAAGLELLPEPPEPPEEDEEK